MEKSSSVTTFEQHLEKGMVKLVKKKGWLLRQRLRHLR